MSPKRFLQLSLIPLSVDLALLVLASVHYLRQRLCGFYCAFTQLSDPVTLTATSEKKIRSGAPSAVPR
jgi:hypothetical protein